MKPQYIVYPYYNFWKTLKLLSHLGQGAVY